MGWLLALIGTIVVVFGFCIWRFKLTNWLSNAPRAERIIDKDRSARLGGGYLILIGICFISFGCAVENLSDQTIMVIVACFIPVNMVILVSYLVAQSRNTR